MLQPTAHGSIHINSFTLGSSSPPAVNPAKPKRGVRDPTAHAVPQSYFPEQAKQTRSAPWESLAEPAGHCQPARSCATGRDVPGAGQARPAAIPGGRRSALARAASATRGGRFRAMPAADSDHTFAHPERFANTNVKTITKDNWITRRLLHSVADSSNASQAGQNLARFMVRRPGRGSSSLSGWNIVTCPPKPDPGVMRVSTGPQAQEMTLDETQATQSRPDHPEVA